MKLTKYFYQSDEEVNSLYNKTAIRYKALSDDTIPSEDRTINKLVAARIKNPKKQQQEIARVQEIFLEHLYRNLKNHGFCEYLAMLHKDDFGVHGEDRVTKSFFRSTEEIPNDRAISTLDLDWFMEKVSYYDEAHGLKTGEEYESDCKNFTIDVFGKTATPADIDDVVNNIFKLLDLNDFFLFATLSRKYGIRFALGLKEEKTIGDKTFLVLSDEYIRSPELILGIAAEVFRDSTIIRMDSIEVILHSKWADYLTQDIFDRRHALEYKYSAICEGFKRLAMQNAGISNIADFRKMKSSLCEDIIKNIFDHEFGHHRANNDMKPEHYDYHWIFPNTDTIGHALQEALADWCGAFPSFMQTAQTDARRATRDIYMYLSDNFFIEEKSEYYAILTDVLVSTALSFIFPDGTVDFIRLAAEQHKIYAFFQEQYRDLVDKLLTVIKNSEYNFGIKKLDFAALETRIVQMHEGTVNEKPLEELRHTGTYWENALSFLEKHSVEGWALYQKALDEETILVKQRLLNLITNGNGKQYDDSLRKFIVERCREIGIKKEPNPSPLFFEMWLQNIHEHIGWLLW